MNGASHQNHLVGLLPSVARRALLQRCQTVQLVRGEVLAEPATQTRHAYFPVDGFVSLIT